MPNCAGSCRPALLVPPRAMSSAGPTQNDRGRIAGRCCWLLHRRRQAHLRGRVGTGIPDKVLAALRRRLDPLAGKSSPLNVLPPRKTRFGSPLVLSRVHWVEPKLVAEITYLTWTGRRALATHCLCRAARGQVGGAGPAGSRARLIGGSGQDSISQRQSGADVSEHAQEWRSRRHRKL
jgi:ATP dependent DNA ligase C terminal region